MAACLVAGQRGRVSLRTRFGMLMEQTCDSAFPFEHGMARGQDGAGDLLIVLAEMVGIES